MTRADLTPPKENTTMKKKRMPPGSIAAFAKSQGIELLPWQVSAAEAIERGDTLAPAPSAKRVGKVTFKRLVDGCHMALGINQEGDPR